MRMRFICASKRTVDSVQEIDLRATSLADDPDNTENPAVLPNDGVAIRNQCNLVLTQAAADSIFTQGAQVYVDFTVAPN